MLDHIEIRTRRIEDCVAFYCDVLSHMGYTLAVDGAIKGFSQAGRLDFWIAEGDPSTDVHYAFTADARAAVDAAYAGAGGHGSTRDRAPALAPHIHPNYYAGYARDPDGRLIEFVSHTPA